ncbi:MAG: hypothetical protein GTO63_25490, partial [Anaerolineae bacterium]|nr:hypothetical protein [Anaerolineae bacterium]NIN98083.1 hypothetical protein [Anaerolineae bacterium]
PREICSYTKGEGDRCTNPVKWEDIAAEQFACGVHMRQYLSDREQELANERERRKKAEAEEVAKWELGFYQDAYRRLNALDPELFPLDDMPQLRWRGVSSDIRIDIIKLDRFVRDHVTQTVPEG